MKTLPVIAALISQAFAGPTPTPTPSLTKERLSGYSNPLQAPARTVTGKNKEWQAGETALIEGEVIQNDAKGLLIFGKSRGGSGPRRATGLLYVEGPSQFPAGKVVKMNGTFGGMRTYTTIEGATQSVPMFLPK